MTSSVTRLSVAQKEEAIRRASAGEVITRIAEDYGVTREAIRQLLRRRGMPPRAVGKLTEAQRSEVIQMYVDGATMAQVAASFGISGPAVRGLLQRRGAPIRHVVHTLRHDAFDVLTADAKYWVGFLFADGTVFYRPGHLPHIGVGLAECDREHLELLRAFLGATTNIYEHERTRSCQFSVRSEQLAGRLMALGRYDGAIDSELVSSHDFWRGVVDGDGSIGIYPRPEPRSSRYAQFRLVGRRRLLDPFAQFLVSKGITGLSVRPHKTIYNIGTTCRPAERIVALLYDGATVALRRKAEIAARVLALRGTSPMAV